MALAVTDADFTTRVLRAAKPVLVKFWAEWCSASRQISPTVEELALDFAGRLIVVSVDMDRNPETKRSYDIRGLPTLILFRNGVPAATKLGSLPKRILASWLETELAPVANGTRG